MPSWSGRPTRRFAASSRPPGSAACRFRTCLGARLFGSYRRSGGTANVIQAQRDLLRPPRLDRIDGADSHHRPWGSRGSGLPFTKAMPELVRST
ncbi:6-phosphogluconate dehydrogenase, decarboxylating (plasmid) [Sinorhizobium fredii CCBAU 83666]|nr:6-phosphogluconate dehydrogenase, decarboxylating [Sinorhizobium fredii CCBAU 83666]